VTEILELLPMVGNDTPANNENAVELSLMSDVVIAYEREHYHIKKLPASKLIAH